MSQHQSIFFFDFLLQLYVLVHNRQLVCPTTTLSHPYPIPEILSLKQRHLKIITSPKNVLYHLLISSLLTAELGPLLQVQVQQARSTARRAASAGRGPGWEQRRGQRLERQQRPWRRAAQQTAAAWRTG